MKKTLIIKNQKGQALIFVVATMTIALAVGIGVAVRNLSSISRTTRTDTALRAQAAAEGAAEKYLSYTDEELESLVGSTETVDFPTVENDNVSIKAEVAFDYYNIPSELGYLPLEIDAQKTLQVLLNDADVEICWSSINSLATELYITVYNDSGDMSKVGLAPVDLEGPLPGPSSDDDDYSSNFETANSGNETFRSCYNLNNLSDIPSSPTLLRITALNGSAKVGIYSSDNLPNQGYKLTSIGKLTSSNPTDEIEDVEVAVEVTRSYSYMPSLFDFSIVSGSRDDSLGL